jgi:hypothetical protein
LHLAEQSRWVDHFSQQRHMQDGSSDPWDKPGQYTFLGHFVLCRMKTPTPPAKGSVT